MDKPNDNTMAEIVVRIARHVLLARLKAGGFRPTILPFGTKGRGGHDLGGYWVYRSQATGRIFGVTYGEEDQMFEGELGRLVVTENFRSLDVLHGVEELLSAEQWGTYLDELRQLADYRSVAKFTSAEGAIAHAPDWVRAVALDRALHK